MWLSSHEVSVGIGVYAQGLWDVVMEDFAHMD